MDQKNLLNHQGGADGVAVQKFYFTQRLWYQPCCRGDPSLFLAKLQGFTFREGDKTVALWKELNKTEPLIGESETANQQNQQTQPPAEVAEFPKSQVTNKDRKESLIGLGLTIEGKIEGQGDMRVAGTFKGDIKVKGDLTVESGAHITGEIGAESMTVGGRVEGNIKATVHVKLLETGELVGDLIAPSLTVASGSRMRGRVEFGWREQEVKKVEYSVVQGAEKKSAR